MSTFCASTALLFPLRLFLHRLERHASGPDCLYQRYQPLAKREIIRSS